MGPDHSPKIVIVDESPIRAAILEEGLREAGFTRVEHIREMPNLLARIYALDPDVILIGDSLDVVAKANGVVRCRGGAAAHLERFRALASYATPIRVRRVKRSQNLAGIALARLHAR